ncbi:hypothetical protein ABWH96_05210 [Marivirga tractuosa]|uniref:hypothetical protein n=1 Tax=Marivirga tractuosa TaxID=1006 RepID=UPI0035CFFEED
MKIKHLLFYSLLSWSLSSCISRLERHSLSGVIVDINKKPIAHCTVGETKTDSAGHFFLPELRYNQFLLTEFLIHEAPPVMYTEDIIKTGYKAKTIAYFHQYGGGIKKGASRELDTIYIVKEKPLQSETKRLLQGTWKVRNSITNDSIFMVRENFAKYCKTRACERFEYIPFTKSSYHEPEPSTNQFYTLTFTSEHFDVIMTTDSIPITGKWKTKTPTEIQLESSLKILNTSYYLQEYDRSYLLLVQVE